MAVSFTRRLAARNGTTSEMWTSITLLKRMCADDPAALDALDRVTTHSVGTNQHSKGVYNVNTLGPRPSGNATDAALRKLRDEYEQNEENELNSAMTN